LFLEERFPVLKSRDWLIFNLFRARRIIEAYKLFWFIIDSASPQIRYDIIRVISVKLKVGPYHLVWVIDRVHYQTH
jgi:hypothetical protein